MRTPPVLPGAAAVPAALTPDDPASSGAVNPGERADRLDWVGAGLSARSRRVTWAVTEALLCDEDERGRLVPASVEVCERAVASLDRAIGRSSADLRRGFAVLTLFIDFLPLFVIGAFSRMSRLPLERRLAYLEALEASRIGLLPMLLVAFKVPLCIAAFEDGEELRLTGFDRESTTSRRKLPVARVREAA